MAETEGGYPRIVDFAAGHLPCREQTAEHGPIASGLTQEHEARRIEQSRHLLQGT